MAEVTCWGNMSREATVLGLRMLFDGMQQKDVALLLYDTFKDAENNKAFGVARDLAELTNTHAVYWVYPGIFKERLNDNGDDERWVGPEAELEYAVANFETPDSIYETISYCLDDYIEEWRGKGWVVPITKEGNEDDAGIQSDTGDEAV